MDEKELRAQLHGAMALGFTFALLLGALGWRVWPAYAEWVMVPGILVFYAGAWYVTRVAARAVLPHKKSDDAS